MKNLMFGLLAGWLLMGMAGCQLNREELLNLTDSAQDQALFENEFSAVFDQIDEVGRNDEDMGGRVETELLPFCADASYDASTGTLTIDYGQDGCLCKDGRIRKGTVTAVFDGKYRTEGTTVTVSLANYMVNDIAVEGSKTITNLGNESGNFRYSYAVRNARITLEDGTTVSWRTDATVERTEGEGTLTPWDDVYLVTGNSTGVNRRGTNFTVDTQTPLTKKIELGCLRNFVSGILTITDLDNDNVMELNYDPDNDQACDKRATVRFNDGNEFDITLR